jgi:hypothetical protein
MKKDERWWLSVNHHLVGESHKSLTNKLLHSRYIANEVMRALHTHGEVRIMKGELDGFAMKNVQELSKDVI